MELAGITSNGSTNYIAVGFSSDQTMVMVTIFSKISQFACIVGRAMSHFYRRRQNFNHILPQEPFFDLFLPQEAFLTIFFTARGIFDHFFTAGAIFDHFFTAEGIILTGRLVGGSPRSLLDKYGGILQGKLGCFRTEI
jgi:hypothetical protein